MELQSRIGTRLLDGLLDGPQNQCFSDDQLENKLQEKVSLMETQYSRMEAEYFKRIKELKNQLQERTRRQQVLVEEVAALREEFRDHQEEISRVTSELLKEKGRSNQPKQPKKNNSPGLLKKSLDTQKKTEKRSSPTAHTINPSDNSRDLNFSGENSNPRAQPKKNYSPSIPSSRHFAAVLPKDTPPEPKSLLPDVHKQHPKDHAKIMPPTIDRNSNPEKSPLQAAKKGYSPKGNAQLKGFLLNSLKMMEKEKPAAPNGSPKRVIRYSPTTNVSGTAAVRKTEPRRALGNLKETMEAF